MNSNEVKRCKIQGFADMIALATVLVVGGMAGDKGITYVAAALLAYAVLWALYSGKAADTLGKLLRIRNVKGQYKSADALRRNVMLFQLAAGVFVTMVLVIGAGAIGGKLFQVQYSTFLMMLLAPALLLRGVSAIFMGFCQGESAELPTAVASVLRRVFILIFSLIFCRGLGSYGQKVSNLLVTDNFAAMYTGVGAVLAINVSEIFVIIFLLVMQKVVRRSKRREPSAGMRSAESFMEAVQNFTVNRAPYFAVQLLLLLPMVLGLLFFRKSTVDWEAGMTDYGVFCGKYLVLGGFCIVLMSGIFIQVCSKTVVALRKGEQRFARVIFQSGIHIIVIYSLFFAGILAVMAEQVSNLLNSGTVAAKLLRGGALIIPFAALALYFARFLMLTGKSLLVLGVLLISDIVYVLSMTLFLNVWKAGILALVYAGIMGGAVCCILLGVIICRQLRIGGVWLHTFLIPAGAACAVGFLCMFLAKILLPHLGDGVTLLVCSVVSWAIYWLILLFARNFNDQELECIPGGKWITSFGQLFHVL
jgi:hypothetical protein